MVAPVDAAEETSTRDAGGRSPLGDGALRLMWHRNRPDAPVFPDQIDDAPAAVALLNMSEVERRYLGSPEPAAEKYGYDGAVA